MNRDQVSTGCARTCPVCHHERANRLFHPSRSPGPIMRCQGCGLVYVAEVRDQHAIIQAGPVPAEADQRVLTSSNLEDIRGSWELALLPAKLNELPASRLNAEAVLDRIERYSQPSGTSQDSARLLDFGCGWGFFLTIAKEWGWEPYGLEPLPGHAVYARVQTGAQVITDTLHDDTFPPAHFAVVTAFQVFEHLPEPATDLARLYRMLQPGGVIVIEVPNVDTWSVRLLGKRHRHFVPDHLTFFSARTLGLLLAKAGFEVLESYRPTRRMTVRHLVEVWGGRYLPGRAVSIAGTMTRRLGLRDRIISLNVGDIVAVIGRKPAP